MKRSEDEKRGWMLVAFFLFMGLLCVILAGNLAIRLAPSWSLNDDMRSRLSPDSILFTPPPGYALQPIDPDILTPPAWINVFLTPGQIYPTRPPRATATPTELVPPTQQTLPTLASTSTPTEVIIYYPTATSTSRPVFTRTPPTGSTATPTSTSVPPSTVKPPTGTATSTSMPTSTPTRTSTPTSTPTATLTATATSTATSTSTPTATSTHTSTPTPTSTPSSTPIPQADLQIAINDGVLVYTAGGTLTYSVVISNAGPANVTGAQIASLLPAQIGDWSWACVSQDNGAGGCDPLGSSLSDFSDTVDLPSGSSITYQVMANIKAAPYGSLSTTVSVTSPAAVPDPAPGNNSATDTNDLLNSLPYSQIGTSPDGSAYVLQPGTSLTLAFNAPLVVNGHPSWDLVLYELPNGTGIAMDWVILQVSDGSNWYTIFNWGDNVPDTDSNLNINILGGQETDNRDFTTIPQSDVLYPFNSGTLATPATGIVLDLDGFIPNGSYPYVRILSPLGDSDGGNEVDAISILP